MYTDYYDLFERFSIMTIDGGVDDSSVQEFEAELEPIGKRRKIAVMEVEDFDNWKSANEVFGEING